MSSEMLGRLGSPEEDLAVDDATRAATILFLGGRPV
jgi:hypothetical protein